jgi:Ribonuclease toxin, BrnT, of type II toxin-antitoxin system
LKHILCKKGRNVALTRQFQFFRLHPTHSGPSRAAALLEIPARVTDEPRWVVIGKMLDKHWSAVFTRRDDNVRIISVRRSRVNVDFPGWMVDSLDREARRVGVTRQSLIKLWLADKLGQKTASISRRS